MHARAIDGQVKQIGLPTSGILTDGRSVSNYHLLPPDILKKEGLLPCEEIKPEYNPETQCLVIDKTQVQSDKVIVTYKVVEMSI